MMVVPVSGVVPLVLARDIVGVVAVRDVSPGPIVVVARVVPVVVTVMTGLRSVAIVVAVRMPLAAVIPGAGSEVDAERTAGLGIGNGAEKDQSENGRSREQEWFHFDSPEGFAAG